MRHQQYYRSITCMVVVCFFLGLAIPTFAEDFQTSREDFRDIFEKAPVESRQSQEKRAKGLSLDVPASTKGPAAIVPDEYGKLIEYPVARSLILFDFDSARVKKDSYPILKNLADTLQYDLPGIKLTVVGHTDSVGSEQYNLELSKRRAQAVKEFLVTNYDIDPGRFFLRWYGETQPYIRENPEDGKNRRVEFVRVE